MESIATTATAATAENITIAAAEAKPIKKVVKRVIRKKAVVAKALEVVSPEVEVAPVIPPVQAEVGEVEALLFLAECPICCEKYNNSTRSMVKCEYSGTCPIEMCKACMRACLMSTPNDAHCFECKKPYTDKYLVTNLSRTWITTDYRKHRRELLYQREGIAKLPESMPAAILKLKKAKEEEKIRIYRHEILKLREIERELNAKISGCYTSMRMITLGGNGEKKEEAATFIMPCPADDCRGYLSSAYKCGLCELYTCSKCFEITGHSRTNDLHICKEENVQSADLIRKETKPCPSCGTRIHKIEGCDQMFCTNCKKPWSWNSGKLDVTGRIHNPHYYQWQRELAEKQGTEMAREPGDVVCGGLCEYYVMRSRIFSRCSLINEDMRTNISAIHRFVGHITNVDLVDIRLKVQRLSNYEDLRIEYINKEITQERLAICIYRNDNSRKKYTEYLHVYELLSAVGTDMFRDLTSISENSGEKFYQEVVHRIKEYTELRDYCNELFANISRTYSQMVPQIDKEDWRIRNKKFSIAKKKKKVGGSKKGASATAVVEGELCDSEGDIECLHPYEDDDFETASQNGGDGPNGMSFQVKGQKKIIVV